MGTPSTDPPAVVRLPSPACAPPVSSDEALGHGLAQGRLLLDHQTRPDAQLERPLELFGEVVPPVVIAGGVRGEVVVDTVAAAVAMRVDMVGLPSALERAAAEVASVPGLGGDSVTLVPSQSLTRGPQPPGAATALAQRTEFRHETINTKVRFDSRATT